MRRSADLCIQVLIVLSMLAYAMETLPDLSQSVRQYLSCFEIATILVFTIEYVLRLTMSDRRLAYATSFFGLIDLFAILPFYLSLGIDLRSLRAFRLLRLIRIFKLARYSKAIQRFHRALLIAKEEIALFLFAAFIMLYFAAVGIYHCEHEAQPEAFASVFHSLWWSLVTLTTVGYGDVYPITTGGKVFTFGVLVIGLGVVSVPAGLVASALSEARRIEASEMP